MKQTKKQSWIEENNKWFIAFTFSIILMIFIILFQVKYFPTTKQYCNKFPDKCVCEDKLGNLHQLIGKIGKFCELRKKNQAEQNIDYCNEHGFDEDKCICEQTKPNEEGIKACSKINGSCYYLLDCFKSRPKTECEKGNPDWVEENKLMIGKLIRKPDIDDVSFFDYIYYKCSQSPYNFSECYQTICREKNK